MILEQWIKKNPKIRDLFPKTNGLFSNINFNFGVSTSLLDYMFISRYGFKSPSPEVMVVRDEGGFDDYEENPLTQEELAIIGDMLLALYLNKWTKLKDLGDIEYDPIHNYLDEWDDHSRGWEKRDDEFTSTREDEFGKVVDTRDSDNLTRTDTFGKSVVSSGSGSLQRTDTFGKTVTSSNTRTDNLTESETINNSVNETASDNQVNSLWGFNSSEAVNSDESVGSNTKTTTTQGTDVTNNTGTVSDSGLVTDGGTESRVDATTDSSTTTDSGTEGRTVSDSRTGNSTESGSETRTLTNVDDYSGSDNRDRSGRHAGNIGNLTSQKMLNEEIELWKWNFINMVLEDCRDFCTLPMYRQSKEISF